MSQSVNPGRERPTPTQEDWENHKPLLWQLWLRDRLPLKDLKTHMEKLGFSPSTGEYRAKFHAWGFHQNVPVETWKYVGFLIEQRRRRREESEVIISGVRMPPEKVRKEISRHFWDTNERLAVGNPKCPPGMFVSVCSPVAGDALPVMARDFSWPATMPYLRLCPSFSRSLHLSHNPSLDGCDSVTEGSPNSLPLDSHNLVPHTGIRGVLRGLVPLGVDSLNQLTEYLSATLPERFHGQHLLRSQLAFEGSEIGTELVLDLFVYLVSNDDIEDDSILAITDEPGLMSLLAHHRDYTMKAPTVLAFVDRLFRLAMDEGLSFLLSYILGLGADPNKRVAEGYRWHANSKYRDPTIRCLALVQLMQEEGKNAESLISVLLSHGASISMTCCAAHGSALEFAANTQNLPIMSLLLQYADQTGLGNLPESDWALVEGSVTTLQPYSYNESLETQRLSYYVMRSRSQRTLHDSLATITSPGSLIRVVDGGGSKRMAWLHERGVNYNCHDRFGRSPLSYVISEAIDRGEDYQCEMPGICIGLLDMGASPDYSPVDSNGRLLYPSALHMAILADEDAVVRIFLQRGADAEVVAAFCNKHAYVTYACAQDCIHKLLTPLRLALLGGAYLCLPELLLCSAQDLVSHGVSMLGDELLHTVEQFRGAAGLIKAIIDRGVDLERKSADGETALQIATRRRDWTSVHVLAKAGAELNLTPDDNARRVAWSFGIRKLGLEDCMDQIAQISHENSGSLLLHAAAGRHLSMYRDESDQLQTAMYSIWRVYPQAYSPYALQMTLARIKDLHKRKVAGGQIQKYEQIAHKLARRRQPGAMTISMEQGCLREAIEIFLSRDDASWLRFFLSQPAKSEVDAPWHVPLCAIPCLEGEQGHWVKYFRGEKHIEVIKMMLHHGQKPNTAAAIGIMTFTRSTALIERFIFLGFNPRRRYPWSETALQIATRHRNMSLVKLLLDLGANANALPAWRCHPTSLGWEQASGTKIYRTALQYAVEGDDWECARVLLAAGADVNAPPAPFGGRTALQLAAKQGYAGVTKWLITLGADVNTPAAIYEGRTALEGAAERGRIDVVHLLLQEGCLVTGEYRTQLIRAVAFARNNGHQAVVSLLQEECAWTEDDEESLAKFQAFEMDDRSWRTISQAQERHAMRGCGGECCDDNQSVDDEAFCNGPDPTDSDLIFDRHEDCWTEDDRDTEDYYADKSAHLWWW